MSEPGERPATLDPLIRNRRPVDVSPATEHRGAPLLSSEQLFS
jgi:hypothetical protein